MPACKKSTNNSGKSYYFDASATDGNTINATGAYVSAAGPSGYPAPVTISGKSANGVVCAMIISEFSGIKGVYAITNTGTGSTTASAYYLHSTADTATFGSYGTMTITAVSPNITGTFAFTCPDSTKVTGSFNVLAPM